MGLGEGGGDVGAGGQSVAGHLSFKFVILLSFFLSISLSVSFSRTKEIILTFICNTCSDFGRRFMNPSKECLILESVSTKGDSSNEFHVHLVMIAMDYISIK